MTIFLVSFVLLCYFHISYCDCPFQKKMFRQFHFDNFKILENSLWSKLKDPVADCGSDCARDEDCVSFFYNPQTKMCITHGVEFRSTAPSTEEEGTVYYSFPVVKDCADVLTNAPESPDGVYTINPVDGTGPFRVFCDMTTDGGGWTVFQRRVNGTTDFYRNWNHYRNGFGDLRGNFWLGNEFIHLLTKQQTVELRVELLDHDNQSGFATYSNFKIENEAENYRLSVDGFNGDRGDSLTSFHNGMLFSTTDRDNDKGGENCADKYGGGWWYYACHTSNLNGIYGDTGYGRGLNWVTWHDHHYSMKWTEMKLRPI